MQIRILSDLHLEFRQMEVLPGSENVLVLAGDIDTHPQRTLDFCRKYLDKGEDHHVLLVLGNHDYYALGSIEKTLLWWHEATLPENMHWLHNSTAVVGNITFAGTTLWTDLQYPPPKHVSDTIHDYKAIQDMHMVPEEHAKAIRFLRSLRSSCVVVTHHLPSERSIHPDFSASPYNAAFFTRLDDLVPRFPIWIHGHTHRSVDYTVLNQSRVVCNPRGYPRGTTQENPDFQANFIITM